MDRRFEHLADTATRHHGLFRLDHAEQLGIERWKLQEVVRAGWCDKPWRGIFRLRGAPETPDQSQLVAVWFGGEGSAASHRGAGRVLGIPGFGGAGPEITKLRGRSQRKPYGLVHGSLVLPSSHLSVRRSIPVTTPARTVFDLAGIVAKGRTERALEHVLEAHLCTMADVRQTFFALARRGRRGTVVMRELLEARGEGYVPPASELERLARQVFRGAGLPDPAFEVDLGASDWVGRVDCVWREERVVVELDGRRHHSSLLARDADRTRDNALMAAGWRVIRVTWDDLRDRPEQVIAWIRQALRSAGRRSA